MFYLARMPLVTEGDAPPEVSVVMASYNARATIARSLHALTALTTDVRFEIVVVDSSTDDTAELVTAGFPAVRLVSVENRLYPGAARNAGIAQARGEILAFTDADCVVEPNWLDELVRLHRSGVTVVGGSIANGNPERLVSWANYFCEFSTWLPGRAAGPISDAPAACLSITRGTFERFGPFVGGTLSSDSDFCRRLVRSGEPPQFAPQVRVAHLNVTELRAYLGRKWRHGRAFARVRASYSAFGHGRCAIGLVVAPGVPALLFVRTGAAAMRAGLRREFTVSAPLVFAGQVAWALGEAVSYARLAVSRR